MAAQETGEEGPKGEQDFSKCSFHCDVKQLTLCVLCGLGMGVVYRKVSVQMCVYTHARVKGEYWVSCSATLCLIRGRFSQGIWRPANPYDHLSHTHSARATGVSSHALLPPGYQGFELLMLAQQELLALSHLPTLSCRVCFREMLVFTCIKIKLSPKGWRKENPETKDKQMRPCTFPKKNMSHVRVERKESVHVTYNAVSIRYLQMCVVSSTLGVFREK